MKVSQSPERSICKSPNILGDPQRRSQVLAFRLHASLYTGKTQVNTAIRLIASLNLWLNNVTWRLTWEPKAVASWQACSTALAFGWTRFTALRTAPCRSPNHYAGTYCGSGPRSNQDWVKRRNRLET